MSNQANATSQGKSFKGTAVITGSSAGMGKLFADRLAKRGYNLILIARRPDRLEAVAKELKDKYGVVAIQTLVADLGSTADLEKVVQDISKDESITLLLNNAGTSTLGLLAESKQPDLDAMVNVNITALTRLTIAVLPGFKKRNSGTIINIGSVLGFHSLPISSVYSGTKGYVLNFTRGLQDELADKKIVVQLVAPAAIATDIWEISGVLLLLPQAKAGKSCINSIFRLHYRCGIKLGDAYAAFGRKASVANELSQCADDFARTDTH